MKHFVLSAVLIAFVGGIALAQDESPEKKKDKEPESRSLTIIGSKSRWSLQPTALKRCPTPFITFLESPPPSTQLKSRREHNPVDQAGEKLAADQSFRWLTAIKQSLLFLGVQHGYALTQPKTRRDLKGPFFKDYVRSVKSLHGWEDGGRFFTNYIAHPMEGSLLGFIQIQNDPKGMNLSYANSNAYWRSRLKALAWSAAWSTQFEIGPVSQASIGNVGLHGKQTYVDLVVTPIGGLGLLVLEDFLDKHIIRMIERRNAGNFYLKVSSRTLLNPTRSIANLLRFKTPWYRDRGLR
ncbi:MAG TPA: hypothetical protein VLB68_01900 [Pyrinomonadaceae bacterium]|nr:hypothetical protein [Pyrinomonadaceae bacterium]